MYNPKIFGFRKQFLVGNTGEDLFLACYEKSKKGDGRIIDLYTENNNSVELKTDSYNMHETPNFFIEHYGNTTKKTLGGPYRAQKDNINYFVYLYIKNKTFFWFKPEKLVARMESLYDTDKITAKYIKNRNYETIGYLVKREDLIDIVESVEEFTEQPF